MNSTISENLFCDYCINSKLAQLKRQKEQEERERAIKEEQEQIEHAKKMQKLELELLGESRRALRSEAQTLAKEIESKRSQKRRIEDPGIQPYSNTDYLREFEQSRAKYRQDLLDQMKAKQETKLQQEQREREAERKRLEELEIEKERSMRELAAESLMQKELYRHTLMQQMNVKNSKKCEESYQKQVERVVLDESVRRFQEEQRNLVTMMKRGMKGTSECGDRSESCGGEFDRDHYSNCSNCNKLLPAYALSKFP